MSPKPTDPFCFAPPSRSLAAAIAIALASASAWTDHAIAASDHALYVAVTSCADSGPGSLREVVANALSGDTILLNQLPCPNRTITLTSGEVPISVASLTITAANIQNIVDSTVASHLTVSGPGALATIDGGGGSRVFNKTDYGYLSLSHFTLRNGVAQGPGGCLRALGDVTLTDMAVTGCTAHDTNSIDGLGGGILVSGNLALQFSRISNNVAASSALASGGGVFVSGSLVMNESTISGNTATTPPGGSGFGGGLYSRGDALVAYSTIANNSAATVGGIDLVGEGFTPSLIVFDSTISGNSGATGGMLALGALHMASTTIAFNTSTLAGGVGGLVLTSTSTLNSTVIANNTSLAGTADIGQSCGPGSGCMVTVGGSNNLFMVATLPVPADSLSDDPLLQPLADNGGLTLTHRPATGSPVIDHGNAVGAGLGVIGADQRGAGFMRIAGAAADIGAFEAGGETDVIFRNGFEDTGCPQAVANAPNVCP